MLQTANNSIVKKPVIFQCVKKVKLFDKPEPFKNRRFTGPEYETELQLAKWMHRPPRQFFYDPPFYPWTVPEPIVNFDLNYK